MKVYGLSLTATPGTSSRFKKTIAAIKAEDWENAAREMLDSQWAKQVGKRARELATMMKQGKYQVNQDRVGEFQLS